jgi:hypothetical protein
MDSDIMEMERLDIQANIKAQGLSAGKTLQHVVGFALQSF